MRLLAKIDSTSLLKAIASELVTPASVEAEIRPGLAVPEELEQLFPAPNLALWYEQSVLHAAKPQAPLGVLSSGCGTYSFRAW